MPISPTVKIEFRLAVENPVEGFEPKEDSGKKIYLNPKVEISEKDIVFAYHSKDQNAYPTIFLELNAEGAMKFETLTANNIQKMLAVVVNGELIMAPIIQTKILVVKYKSRVLFLKQKLKVYLKALQNLYNIFHALFKSCL
jgi:preprotein translocase subunit SecD